MELHNYNTYSSTYNSNARRVLYLALNRYGEPRRTQIPANRSLGKLATYTNAITETVPQERVEQLIAKNFGANRVKHGVRQLCDTGKPLIQLIDTLHFKGRPQCNNNNSNSNSISSSSSSSSSNSSSNSSSSSSSSSSNSNSNSSSNVPVPAASASSLISISNSSQSESGHINSSNSSNSNSSSNSSSSNSSSNKKRKKLRKCKQHESEELHNCHKRPANAASALRKRGPKAQRCKELREKAAADGGPPPNCGKKGGGKRNMNNNNNSPAMQRPRAGNTSPNLNPLHALGKKKSAKLAGSASGKQRPQVGYKKQQRLNASQVGNGKRKHHRTTTSTTTTTTTTTMASSLATPADMQWESSSPLPAMALSETSDRVERNVRRLDSEEQEPAEADDEDDEEESSFMDASYEDAEMEAHGRSGSAAGAGDDSLYYDLIFLWPLLLFFGLQRTWLL
ncbi:micronuclear linker histone polyprotein isoform X2 [Drosophila tropicalis]